MALPALTPVLVDAPTLRARLHSKVTKALEAVFPLDLKGRTIELKDVTVHAKDYSPVDQKRALMTGKNLEESIKGTLVMKDSSGKVLDTAENFTLAHVPYFTERHTVISGGNEFQFANQIRRKPGVYSQRSESGRLHSMFNLSKGKNLDIEFNPERGTFYVVPSQSSTHIPLYPLLTSLGMSHSDIADKLGKGVADVNKARYGAPDKAEKAVTNLYTKLVHPALFNPAATTEQKLQLIKDKFRQTVTDPDVTEITLGHRFESVTPAALLSASRRLLAIHEGKEEVDDADSLAFKTFHSVDDYLAENVALTGREWKRKVHLLMRGKNTIREGLKAAPFTNGIRKFTTTSVNVAVPTGINPIELIDHAVKVTAMGEGGIPSNVP